MYLEHLNLVVEDIPASLAFYQAAFPHWQVRAEGSGEWNGKARNWLHYGSHEHYIAFSDNGDSKIRDSSGHQVGLSHFAFVTNNLDATIERLSQHGFVPSSSGAKNIYRKNIYYKDPAGFEIEFVEYLSDLPELRNSDD